MFLEAALLDTERSLRPLLEAGEAVDQGQVLGRSGMTGLAGGDHLHFAMLLAGHPVNPVEWWDPHWIQDRILRKLRDAPVGAP